MKRVILFWSAILLPGVLLRAAAMNGNITAVAFTSLLFFYLLIYHPLLSGLRLLRNNKITTRDFWMMFIPIWSGTYYSKHFRFLYFNR